MTQFQTGNHGFLRQQNLTGIMHYLYENAPISRVDLARLTYLNKTTVSSLIEELLENGFVREIGIEKLMGAGRNSILLDINPGHGYIVSGEIGRDFIHVICTDFSAKVVWRHKEPLNNLNADKAFSHLFEILQNAVRFAGAQGNLLGLSLGVPGLFDKETGILLFAPNSGWYDVPLLDMLKQNFRTEVFVDNEANLAALGEQFFGAAQGHKDVLYISVGEGLGGGLVLQGQVYNGSTGVAGEFGHMTTDSDGFVCSCGNRGCWETEVSKSALIRHISNAIVYGEKTNLAKKLAENDGKLSIEDIVKAAEANDQVALDALKQVGRELGIGLASLLNILNPSLTVLGGEISSAAEFLLPFAKEELKKRSLRWSMEKTEIVVARFGSEAALMGGVATVFQAVLANLSSLKRKRI